MRRPRLMLALQLGAMVAILVGGVALTSRTPWRLDLTPERRFTLSAHTRSVLAELATDVTVTVFYASRAGLVRRDMADLLARYEEATARVRVRFLDLDRNPAAASRLGVDTYNTAVVTAGRRHARVAPVTESTVTEALLAVLGHDLVAAFLVVGHGEHDPAATNPRRSLARAARVLAREGFLVRRLEGAATLQPGAGLVILAGPRRDLTEAETRTLDAHVRAGGRLLVLADPGTPARVRALVARFGIELLGDVVVDERGRRFGADGSMARVAELHQALVPVPLPAHPLLPGAQTMRLITAPDVRASYLALTPEDTFADVDRRDGGDGPPGYRPGRDHAGPLPVAAFARVGATGRVVVIGDADFATDHHLDVGGNHDLLLAAVGLLTREATAAPMPSRPSAMPPPLTPSEARRVLWGASLAPAGLLALVAIVLARRRRAL